MATEIPQKFFGKFKHERSENFDEYLASRGVNWFVRKMIQMSSLTKVFEQSKDQTGRYNFFNLSAKKNTEYKNWALNETFEGDGLDGTRHKVTFTLPDPDTVAEHHVRIETPDDKGETYFYTVEGDHLILKLQNDAVVCRRFFKKIE